MRRSGGIVRPGAHCVPRALRAARSRASSCRALRRARCVYEWALFLVLHDTEHVQLCVDFFLSERTLQRYVAAIREFKLARARTYYTSDIGLMRERIEAMYQSVEHFERFVQLAVISLIAVVVAKRASPIPEAASAENDLLVWARLAAELGFAQLADVLARARPAAWLAHAAPAEGGGVSARMRWMVGGKTWRAHLAGRVDSWYQHELKPLFCASRALAVRPAFLDLKSPSPLTATEWQAAARSAYACRLASSTHATLGDGAHGEQAVRAPPVRRESIASMCSLSSVETGVVHEVRTATGASRAHVGEPPTPSRGRKPSLEDLVVEPASARRRGRANSLVPSSVEGLTPGKGGSNSALAAHARRPTHVTPLSSVDSLAHEERSSAGRTEPARAGCERDATRDGDEGPTAPTRTRQ